MRIWVYIVLFFGGTLGSCVKEVRVTDSGEKPNAYFLNAFLCEDSQARVQIGRVSGITEAYDFVADASVVLVSKGQRFPMAHVRDGWYASSLFVAAPNDSIRLEVVHGLKGFTRELRSPTRLQIQGVQTFPVVVGFLGRTTGFRLRFRDSAYTDNFYRLYVEERYWLYEQDGSGARVDSVLRVRKLPISGNDLAFLRNPYNVYASRELLFNDVTFNGLRYSFEFYRALGVSVLERTESYRVVVENLHPDLYRYYNDRNAHLWQQGSITQTPTKVEGNIANVYGIFGLYQVAEFVVRF